MSRKMALWQPPQEFTRNELIFNISFPSISIADHRDAISDVFFITQTDIKKERWQYRKIAIRIALESHLMQTRNIITIKAPQTKKNLSSNKTLNFELSRGNKNWIMTQKTFYLCGVISNVWTHYFWINKVWINMLPIIWCHFSCEQVFSWRKLFMYRSVT